MRKTISLTRRGARTTLLLLVGLALFVACNDDPIKPARPEVFQGWMVMTPNFNSNPMLIYPDSIQVEFVVEGSLYDLYLVGTSQSFNLCSSRGEVRHFGTNVATLTPTGLIAPSNCDSIHIPRGDFPAIFRSDSLYLGPKAVGYTLNVNNATVYDTLTFHFKLRQTQ